MKEITNRRLKGIETRLHNLENSKKRTARTTTEIAADLLMKVNGHRDLIYEAVTRLIALHDEKMGDEKIHE